MPNKNLSTSVVKRLGGQSMDRTSAPNIPSVFSLSLCLPTCCLIFVDGRQIFIKAESWPTATKSAVLLVSKPGSLGNFASVYFPHYSNIGIDPRIGTNSNWARLRGRDGVVDFTPRCSQTDAPIRQLRGQGRQPGLNCDWSEFLSEVFQESGYVFGAPCNAAFQLPSRV